MSRCKKDPLRPLTEEEREILMQISRSHNEPASHVARSKALLAVADGNDYTKAAALAGRRSGDAKLPLLRGDVLATPFPNWFLVLTGKGWQRLNLCTEEVLRLFMVLLNKNEFYEKPVVNQPRKKMALPSGLCQFYEMLYAKQKMG
jgi:hypothetical protein